MCTTRDRIGCLFSFFFIIINGYNGMKNLNSHIIRGMCSLPLIPHQYDKRIDLFFSHLRSFQFIFHHYPFFSVSPSPSFIPLYLILTCVVSLSLPLSYIFAYLLSHALQSNQESVSNFKFVITIPAMIMMRWAYKTSVTAKIYPYTKSKPPSNWNAGSPYNLSRCEYFIHHFSWPSLKILCHLLWQSSWH